MIEIPNYPVAPPAKKLELDAVARSLAKPEPFAKPGTIGRVRVRTTLSDKSLKPKRHRRRRDKRDVVFY